MTKKFKLLLFAGFCLPHLCFSQNAYLSKKNYLGLGYSGFLNSNFYAYIFTYERNVNKKFALGFNANNVYDKFNNTHDEFYGIKYNYYISGPINSSFKPFVGLGVGYSTRRNITSINNDNNPMSKIQIKYCVGVRYDCKENWLLSFEISNMRYNYGGFPILSLGYQF